jgi:L-serine dehydratase
MKSIRELYRIGHGPSSSHTMGPVMAAEQFLEKYPEADSYAVKLFGSLAATGKGHLTDKAILEVFGDKEIEVLWHPKELLPEHPNGMEFIAQQGGEAYSWQVYSIGGGALFDPLNPQGESYVQYPHTTMTSILKECSRQGLYFWEFVEAYEEEDIWKYLEEVYDAMMNSIKSGLTHSGVLPGGLGVQRKASSLYRKSQLAGEHGRRTGLLSAYSHAISEVNAAGGIVVTAPTCGSSGVLPSVLRYLSETIDCGKDVFLQALATAGLVGNIIKHNASISGAEVGCQGEIGSACAMAAAAATHILGGTNNQIEYAAEMGLEHFLGLTCDPVAGMVQIPCIERNTFGATRAMSVADYAMLSDGTHRVSFDQVVAVMKQTGKDLPSLYRETSEGGLATHVSGPE